MLSRNEKAQKVFHALRPAEYRGSWQDYEDMIASWAGYGNDPSKLELVPTPEEVVYACYNNESYEGSAILIYYKGLTLYEVNGSHCSCNGLEECWEPEETSWPAIAMRVNSGYREWAGLEDVIAIYA